MGYGVLLGARVGVAVEVGVAVGVGVGVKVGVAVAVAVAVAVKVRLGLTSMFPGMGAAELRARAIQPGKASHTMNAMINNRIDRMRTRIQRFDDFFFCGEGLAFFLLGGTGSVC